MREFVGKTASIHAFLASCLRVAATWSALEWGPRDGGKMININAFTNAE